MGLCSSSPPPAQSAQKVAEDAADEEDDEYESLQPLTKSQLEARKISGTGVITMPSSGIRMNYAYLTQRGYYPDQPDKANQDNYNVIEKFTGSPDKVFFGVFDGHGKDGDLASYYARDKIPKCLAMWSKSVNLRRAHKKSFVDVNDKMCSNSVFDTMMSGTTAITALLDGDNLIVANCGDSRCVVAVDNQEGGLLAHPLSRDQTPHRRDELRRVKRAGAMVCNMAQLEGAEPMHENWSLTLGDVIDDGGDPPRLFLRGKVYPGVAFTRSIGDALAQGIGVFAEPEIDELKLNSSHKFLILASDGIWEFITNQEAVDILEKNRNSPLRACQALVQKAYQLWLQYEVRTDDITVIVIELNGLKDPSAGDVKPAAAPKTLAKLTTDAKRRKTRKKIANNKQLANLQPYYPEEHIVKKEKIERDRIRQAVKENFLFSKLKGEQLELTIDVMQRQTVCKGDILIREGDEGDKFYIAELGTFDVFVQDKKVHEYNAGNEMFPSFGELALLHGAPRKATIKATSDGKLWVLGRLAFQTMLMISPEASLLKQLQQIKTLRCIPVVTLEKMCEIMVMKTFKDGEAICRQREPAHEFYVVKSGKAAIEQDGRQMLLGQRYFGERALITADPRKATVKARGSTTCYTMSRTLFEDNFGPMKQYKVVYDRQHKHNEELVQLLHQYTEDFGGGLTVFGKTHSDREPFKGFCMDADDSPCAEKYVVSADSIDGKLTVVTLHDKIYSVKSILCLGTAAVDHVKNQAKLAVELSTSCRAFGLIVAQRKEETLIDESSKDIWVHTLMEGEICSSVHMLFDDDHPVFTVDESRYVCASMIMAICQAHLHNIIYRSVVPEFIGLDRQGRVKLHHLELAKQTKFMEQTRTRCGMPEFMAPEQILGSGHGPAVDLWALGVLTYDLLCGSTPFAPNHESALMAIYENILAHDGGTKKGFGNHDAKVSPEAMDFICKLLHPEPAKRLGSNLEVNTAQEIGSLQSHPWFKGFDWKALENETMESPLAAIVGSKTTEDLEVADEGFLI